MVLPLAVGAFGALIGSFLNVVVYRLPRGQSLISPASACGHCGHAIRPYDNIPIVSWLLLGGRCRDCDARISVRYPLVELGTAVFFGLVAWRFLPSLGASSDAEFLGSVVELVAFLFLAAASLALALIDLETKRLPNALVMPLYGVLALFFAAAAGLTGSWDRLAVAGIGMVGLAGTYLALALIKPGAMGMGDVKLAGAVGLALGWLGVPELLVGAMGGFVLGGVFGIGLLLAGRGRRTAIAYGPWLLGGAWVGAFAGEPIAQAYLSTFGIT
jgi:leader peptidase (prepilin peptidase)/N-methyltransferase